LDLQGFSNAPIRDVTLRDCEFNDVTGQDILRYVEGLTYDNVRINGQPAKPPT
jgi:hypothetical protein